jgi:hypothetical protein
VFVDPGRVPKGWQPEVEQQQEGQLLEVKRGGGHRWAQHGVARWGWHCIMGKGRAAGRFGRLLGGGAVRRVLGGTATRARVGQHCDTGACWAALRHERVLGSTTARPLQHLRCLAGCMVNPAVIEEDILGPALRCALRLHTAQHGDSFALQALWPSITT